VSRAAESIRTRLRVRSGWEAANSVATSAASPADDGRLLHVGRVQDGAELVGPLFDGGHVRDRNWVGQAGAALIEDEHPTERSQPRQEPPDPVMLPSLFDMVRPVPRPYEINGPLAANLTGDVAVAATNVLRTVRLQETLHATSLI
jgi:hypothetical protein